MSRKGLSPKLGIKRMIIENPKIRILQIGQYVQRLKVWQEFFTTDKMKIYIFEDDVVREPKRMLFSVYDFLGIDTKYIPEGFDDRSHKSLSTTRIFLNHYTSNFTSNFFIRSIGKFVDRFDFLRSFAITSEDKEFLRSVFLPEKEELESIIGRDLSCWDYGRP